MIACDRDEYWLACVAPRLLFVNPILMSSVICSSSLISTYIASLNTVFPLLSSIILSILLFSPDSRSLRF